MNLHPDLKNALVLLRKRRSFNVSDYIKAKTQLLSSYLKFSDINTCVIGISGGIDSAVTLGLLHQTMHICNSSLKKIIPVFIPLFVNGASNQKNALERGKEVVKIYNLDPIAIDLSHLHSEWRKNIETSLGISGNSWAQGQLVSYLRTPALYYLTTLLTQEGFHSVVCGTTNRDEGGYLGFFGKASDGMVDIQLISDIHKSEVYQLADYLCIPDSIKCVAPSGDTYDAKTDEEMLGVSYDFVELYLQYLALPSSLLRLNLTKSWSLEAKEQFEKNSKILQARHQSNHHKYYDGSPAVHLDVYERAVPGGWKRSQMTYPKNNIIPANQFVGYFKIDPSIIEQFTYKNPENSHLETIKDFGHSASLIKNFITLDEINILCQEFKKQQTIATDYHGKPLQANTNLPTGSYRASIYSEELASLLFTRLAHQIPALKSMNDYSTSADLNHSIWRACGLNPLFRFICYPPGGYLVPHYDEGYDFKDNSKYTLMSVIIYLTEAKPEEGGETHLLRDKQRFLPIRERIFLDHFTLASPHEILATILPQAGTALIFDHRILHESAIWLGTHERIVLRTDIVFEKCGLEFNHSTAIPTAKPDFINQLGIPIEATTKQVDEAYQRKTFEEKIKLRTAWKVMRDPFYARAYEASSSYQDIVYAGFFDDGKDLESPEILEHEDKFLITPLHKITNHINKIKKNEEIEKKWVVLMTTGAMSPVHDGHIALLELAKKELEKQGMHVIGGYLSPDHDVYVNQKKGQEAILGIERLKLCEQAVSKSDWLAVDPWQIYCHSTAINFTTVVERMSSYIAFHIHSHHPIHVIYVVGGDNARLALSFIKRGQCIVVPRVGFEEELNKISTHPLIKNNEKIIFSSLDNKPPGFSSTEMIKQKKNLSSISYKKKRIQLLIRDEEEWAVAPWYKKVNPDILKENRRVFLEGLVALLKKSYEEYDLLGIKLIKLKEQIEKITKDLSGKSVLSLDPCIEGDVNLKISRCYPVGSSDSEPLFVTRPGSPELTSQLASLSTGDYVLLDDDLSTGKTLNYVLNILAGYCSIKQVYTSSNLGEMDKKINEEICYELCDSRDFLLGARDAGLVISLPNHTIARAPYIMPYVRPAIRLSMPISQEFLFSKNVWQLNKDFFKNIKTPLHIGDMSDSSKQLAHYLGFQDNVLIEDLCQWHINFFEEIEKDKHELRPI